MVFLPIIVGIRGSGHFSFIAQHPICGQLECLFYNGFLGFPYSIQGSGYYIIHFLSFERVSFLVAVEKLSSSADVMGEFVQYLLASAGLAYGPKPLWFAKSCRIDEMRFIAHIFLRLILFSCFLFRHPIVFLAFVPSNVGMFALCSRFA